MSDSQIVMKVPEEVIDAQVRAAVVRALGDDPARLIQAVVDVAMSQKDKQYEYRKPNGDYMNLFEVAVNKMIRDAAQAIFKQWLDEQRDTIKQAIAKRLRASPKVFIDKVADALTEGMASRFSVSFRISGD